jgi:acetyl-CoA C-acetyltransferase
MPLLPRTPVLIGAGQVVSHWAGEGDAPSPQGLRARAARRALADTGQAAAIAAAIDQVAVVRTMADSIPGFAQPGGRSGNPPGALAAALGLAPRHAIYSRVGGDQPQALVNEAAEAIFAGAAEAVLIAGAEATAAAKLALRRGLPFDWTDPPADMVDMEDRGFGPPLAAPADLAAGLGRPVRTYPLFEHALRARWGESRDAYRALMSELWAGFSRVAVANPYAQFPVERSAPFLSTPSPDNYPISDPYLKWDVAQDAVNQGAALILTSVAAADRLNVAPDKRIYLHAYAEAADRPVSQRPDLSRSRPIELALAHALAAAELTPDRIGLFDIYSCFPCAVLLAAEALEIDRRVTPLTVTGGLPFFGGPGNSYSLHAIATMAEQLRARPGAFGLVLANGGYLSKEAVGIYSAAPPPDWRPISSAAIQREIDAAAAPALAPAQGNATVESFTVPWSKGQPSSGIVSARRADGARILAQSRDLASVQALLDSEPLGRQISFVTDESLRWSIH